MKRLNDILNHNIEDLHLSTITLDWSRFDTSIPDWLLNIGLDIVENLIDFNTI